MATTGNTAPAGALTGPAAFDSEAYQRRLSGRRHRRYIPIAAGMLMVVLMLVCAVLAPLISPFSPSAQFSDYVLEGPGGRHLLGTDEFGRDVLSRIIWGTRVSLQVGLGAVVVGFLVGVPLGILAGFRGGGTEAVIMRCTDMLLAFPTLLLALIIVTALGGSLLNEIIAIGVALTPSFVRLARSMALTIKENDYIMAARALGGTPLRLMVRHIFPERRVHAGRHCHAVHRQRHPHRSRAELPRPRRAAAHRQLGQHPQRGPPVHQVLPVADDVLRPLHHAGGAVVQHHGRRAARPARPAAARGLGRLRI